jgi:molecular chaperone GrpE
MTKTEFEKIMKKYGVTEYNPINEKFDPNYHEAFFQFEDQSREPDTVGEVLQIGYKIGKRILRAPKVSYNIILIFI